MTIKRPRVRPDQRAFARASLRRAVHHARDPSMVLLACQVLGAVVAFVANIAAARILDPSGRGELALLLQIAYLSSLGLLLGCDRSVVTVYSGHPASTVARAFVRLLVAPSALLLIIAFTALALPIPEITSWRSALSLAALFAVANAFVRAVRSVAIAAGRNREFIYFSLTSETIMLVGLGLLVLAGVESIALWMLLYLVVGTVPPFGWLLYWAMAGSPVTGEPSVDRRRAARREGLAVLPSAVAHSGILRIDRLLLAGLASTTALGMYAAVGTITELIAWPLLAFADSRLGRWREAHDAGELRMRTLLVGILLYCVVAVAALAVTLRLLLVPMLGSAYEPAKSLVLPLAVAAAVFGVSQILITLLIATRKALSASAIEVGGFAVSVVAYVLLIQRWEALGAAYGSLLGYAACLTAAALLLLVSCRGR